MLRQGFTFSSYQSHIRNQHVKYASIIWFTQILSIFWRHSAKILTDLNIFEHPCFHTVLCKFITVTWWVLWSLKCCNPAWLARYMILWKSYFCLNIRRGNQIWDQSWKTWAQAAFRQQTLQNMGPCTVKTTRLKSTAFVNMAWARSQTVWQSAKINWRVQKTHCGFINLLQLVCANDLEVGVTIAWMLKVDPASSLLIHTALAVSLNHTFSILLI
jgi:hypothetical protein